MKIRLTLTVQKVFEVEGDINLDTDEWPEAYKKKEAEVIDKLEAAGWDVSFEQAEEEDDGSNR
jgi:hypothetical protein